MQTIMVVLESASKVCTFEAVKMELTKYLNESCEKLYDTLKKWFLDQFGKSFGSDKHLHWVGYTAVREIKVQLCSYITI